jgi:hypothetical protein
MPLDFRRSPNSTTCTQKEKVGTTPLRTRRRKTEASWPRISNVRANEISGKKVYLVRFMAHVAGRRATRAPRSLNRETDEQAAVD